MQTLLIVFIVVTGLAVVIQAGVLVSLYMSVKKTSSRVESIAGDLQQRAVPALDAATAILNNSRGNLQTLTENLAATSTSLRNQVERVETTMGDIIDRTRLQVIRADELVSRTLDRVEETSEFVQHTVISPVKQLAGLVSGLTVGLDAFFRRRKGPQRSQPQTEDEELFI